MKRILKSIIVAVLEWEAKLVLKKYKPKIIAVTGSVGKTSTKDAIYTVVSNFYSVRKSEKSFNSEIGVPLTILGLPNGWNNPMIWLKNIFEGLLMIVFKQPYPDWLILEIGADRPGDIARITKTVKPDIALVTRLSKIPVHVEYFGSPEDLYTEKGNLVKALKNDGTLVLNSDDEDVMLFKKGFEGKVVSYGFHEPADLIARDAEIVYEDGKTPSGISFFITKGMDDTEVKLNGSLGYQHAYAVLGAFAVGDVLGFEMSKMVKAFEFFESTAGRMSLVPGIKNTLIIDDTYNSSPVALREALKTLENIKTEGRKVAVLGDMLELGVFSTEEHKKAGEEASKVCDILFTVGVRARGMVEGALDAGMDEKKIFQYDDSQRAGDDLEIEIKPGDVILIKGSQGIRMERIVEEIMAEPEKKKTLLVRQDEEWMNR